MLPLKPDSEKFIILLHGNWADPKYYPDEKTDMNGWGWEFLRRNKSYQNKFYDFVKHEIEFTKKPYGPEDEELAFESSEIEWGRLDLGVEYGARLRLGQFETRELSPLNNNRSLFDFNGIKMKSLNMKIQKKSNETLYSAKELVEDELVGFNPPSRVSNLFLEINNDFAHNATEDLLKKMFLKKIREFKTSQKIHRIKDDDWDIGLRLYDAKITRKFHKKNHFEEMFLISSEIANRYKKDRNKKKVSCSEIDLKLSALIRFKNKLIKRIEDLISNPSFVNYRTNEEFKDDF